jgi:hypothetical protein
MVGDLMPPPSTPSGCLDAWPRRCRRTLPGRLRHGAFMGRAGAARYRSRWRHSRAPGQKSSPVPWGSWPSARAQRRNSSKPSPMSRAMNSEASSSMRWSEKPSAASWGRAWLARSRALSTSEALARGSRRGLPGPACRRRWPARAGRARGAGRRREIEWPRSVHLRGEPTRPRPDRPPRAAPPAGGVGQVEVEPAVEAPGGRSRAGSRASERLVAAITRMLL